MMVDQHVEDGHNFATLQNLIFQYFLYFAFI